MVQILIPSAFLFVILVVSHLLIGRSVTSFLRSEIEVRNLKKLSASDANNCDKLVRLRDWQNKYQNTTWADFQENYYQVDGKYHRRQDSVQT